MPKINSGVKGFEPLSVDIKNRCLSTWLYSIKKQENSNLVDKITYIINNKERNTNVFK